MTCHLYCQRVTCTKKKLSPQNSNRGISVRTKNKLYGITCNWFRDPCSSVAFIPSRPNRILSLCANFFVGRNTKQWSLKDRLQRAGRTQNYKNNINFINSILWYLYHHSTWPLPEGSKATTVHFSIHKSHLTLYWP